MSLPRVYAAINAVTAAFARHGIAKEHLNSEDDYAYRSIDDVLNRLSPLLAEHRLCVLPRVLERSFSERQGLAGELLLSVSLRVAYDLVCVEDGSVHAIEVAAEALDPGDKGTAKAMQSAYKYAMIQTFSIPVSGTEDADSRSLRSKARENHLEPGQGWDQWRADVEEMIRVCESREAVDRVLERNRGLLAVLQRERPELYTSIGNAVTSGRAKLATTSMGPAKGPHSAQNSADGGPQRRLAGEPGGANELPKQARRRHTKEERGQARTRTSAKTSPPANLGETDEPLVQIGRETAAAGAGQTDDA